MSRDPRFASIGLVEIGEELARARDEVKPTGLVGLFFLARISERQTWQGEVTDCVASGLYLVQLYGWGGGQPIEQRLVKIADMDNWRFYADEEQWRATGSEEIEACAKRIREEVREKLRQRREATPEPVSPDTVARYQQDAPFDSGEGAA